MRYAVFLSIAAGLLAGCNSNGDTRGEGGANQTPGDATGVTFVEPAKVSFGYHEKKPGNEAFLSIDLDDRIEYCGIGIEIHGANLGSVFAEPGNPSVFVVIGTGDLGPGSNNVSVAANGSSRDITSKLLVKNYDINVTDKAHAAKVREASVYAFREKTLPNLRIFPLKLSSQPKLPTLPGSFDLKLDLNSIYNQSVSKFLNVTVNSPSDFDWLDNGDKVLDIIHDLSDLGPEVKSILQGIPRSSGTVDGIFTPDINVDFEMSGSILKGGNIITLNSPADELLPKGTKFIVGPYNRTAANICSEIFTVQNAVGNTIFTVEPASCAHPGGDDLLNSHFVKAQNTVLGIAYPEIDRFFFQKADMANIEITIAHECGHLKGFGELDHVDETGNLMEPVVGGTHLNNDQWVKINP